MRGIRDWQQRVLTDQLVKNGWEIVHRQREELEWWADEIWTVESLWSPHGLRVYLTFLVDPQPPSDIVWAVGASLEPPTSRIQAGEHGIVSRSFWPQEMPLFVAKLSKLRSEHRSV
jgi:hypothetical protein